MTQADAQAGVFAAGKEARRRPRAGWVGGVMLMLIALPCYATLPWSLTRYEGTVADLSLSRRPPSFEHPMGTDTLGRSLLWRCLLGGAISLSIGAAAALVAVVIGVAWGAIAGYAGGRTDAAMMRFVDVLYGLPYILLVVLVTIALQPAVEAAMRRFVAADAAQGVGEVVTLWIAIGGVSWLTLARVIRGQVLSLRGQPFIEAARATGVGPWRMLRAHLLPNLAGPIVVYATLTVPTAILQESFLSFLGIGVQEPLPSWGGLAAAGVAQLPSLSLAGAGAVFRWWLLLWPCLLLGLTLLSLNFLGDALRARRSH